MKFGKKILGTSVIGYAFLSSIAFADDVVVGRDRDIPDAQPPVETEGTTPASMLSELLEIFGVDVE